MKKIENGNIPGVRMDKQDAPRIRARSGGVVYGTHFVYDSDGPILPVSGTTERFNPNHTNWQAVVEMIGQNPNMDIETAKRKSIQYAAENRTEFGTK